MTSYRRSILAAAVILVSVQGMPTRDARGAVMVESDFASSIPPYWLPWVTTGGNAEVSVVNGAARFTVFKGQYNHNPPTCCYADAEINDWMDPASPPQRRDPMPWLYVNVDFRARASNTTPCPAEGLVGTGVGMRGWGFWDGTASNFLWFLGVSSESASCGYSATSRTGGGVPLGVPVGPDMTQWHDYRIVWRPSDSALYIDGTFIAAVRDPPMVRMGLVFWIDNGAVDSNGLMNFLDVPEDQFVELDWVRVYTSRARFTNIAGADRGSYPLGTGIVVTVDDPDENLDRALVETMHATVADPTTGDSETIILTETGPDSGEFRSAPLPTSSGAAVGNDGVLETQLGNTVTLVYDANDPTNTDADTATIVPLAVFSDNFNDNARSGFWGYTVGGTGLSVNETGGKLQVTIPDSSTLWSGFPLTAGFLSSCTLSGDFDVQVDYQLVSPPLTTGLLGILAWPQVISGPVSFGGMGRGFVPDGYRIFAPSVLGSFVPTSDMVGRIRLQRSGAMAQGSYNSGSGWTAIGSPLTFSTSPTRISLNLSEANTAGQTAQATFDNFVVSADTLTCPLNQLCGDGVTQSAFGESCDDGNEIVGDGCCACRTETSLPSAPDVAGNWQLNVDCPGSLPLARPFTLSQTSGTGAATATPDGCGTFPGLDGQIRQISSCDLSPHAAQVCGNVFAYEPSSETVGFSPFSSTLGTCTNVATMVSQLRFNGTVTADATNRAIAIAGLEDLRSLRLFNVGATDPCFDLAGTFCNFEMRRNLAAIGQYVTLEPLAGVTISFDQVDQDMRVGVTPETTPAAALPPNFAVLVAGQATPVYLNISNEGGGFTGQVTVCLSYPDTDGNGIVDGTSVVATDLQIAHAEGSTFVDRTVQPVDTVNKRVCARVASFSQFVIGTTTAMPTPLLDHFTCYKAGATSGSVKFPGIPGVSLLDQFGGSIVEVKKPKSLCAPTNKNNEDPGADLHTEHLKGYQIKNPSKPSPVFPTHLKVVDQFNSGGLFVDAKKQSHLLVPTVKDRVTPPPLPGSFIVDHFQCYKVKTSSGAPKFEPVLNAEVEDQFGIMHVDVKKPTYLCTPVDKKGEDPTAPTHTDHLMCYQVKQVKTEPHFQKVVGVFVNNQFGPEQLDVKKPSELCVPAQKTL